MLAKQVGGHTPTLKGFHWRHDALLHQGSGMTVGLCCGLLLCEMSICFHKQRMGCS